MGTNFGFVRLCRILYTDIIIFTHPSWSGGNVDKGPDKDEQKQQ